MLGDIEPITAQEFIRQMEEISKEERKNQTNEQWFCSLSTAEKAEWFAKKSKEIIDDFANFDFKSNYKNYWIAWLKEAHEA